MGVIYACGSFTGLVAKWNGSGWVTLDNLLIYGNEARTLHVYDNKLIVGGDFELTTGALRKNVAAWDGENMVLMGFGTPTPVNDFEIYYNNLYAACDFINGNDTCSLAIFQNENWRKLLGSSNSTSLNAIFYGTIYDLHTINSDLIIAGNFVSDNLMIYGNNLSKMVIIPNDTAVVGLAITDSTIYSVNPSPLGLIIGGHFVNALSFNLNRIGIVNNVYTSIPFINKSSSLNIFPNPASEFANISISKPFNTINLSIFSADGKIVETHSLNKNEQLNTSSFAKGLCFISATDEDGNVFNSKLIKN